LEEASYVPPSGPDLSPLAGEPEFDGGEMGEHKKKQKL